jgi:hypothetical protein
MAAWPAISVISEKQEIEEGGDIEMARTPRLYWRRFISPLTKRRRQIIGDARAASTL